jgi:predicted nucleic acid-binding Zn ribbon protein
MSREEKITRLCANPRCGKPIPPWKRDDALFCCKACSNALSKAAFDQRKREAAAKVPLPLCRWCKTPFVRNTNNQVFCCEECGRAHYNAKKRETRNRSGVLMGGAWNLEYDPWQAGEVAVYGGAGVVVDARMPSAALGF